MTSPDLSSRRNFFDLALLGAILLFAALLRSGSLNSGFWPDEAKYAWYARQILHHPAHLVHPDINAFTPPLFTLFLLPAQGILPAFAACRMTAVFFGLLGLVVIYAVGRRLGGRDAGLMAAGLAAGHPDYLLYSVKVLPDIPLMIFMTVLAASLVRASRPWRIALLSCGALLIKWSAVLILPWMLWLAASGREHRRCLRGPLAAAGALTGGLVLANIFTLGHPWPGSSALFKAYVPQSVFYYFIELPRLAGGGWVLALAFWGLYQWRAHPAGKVFAGWIVIFMLGLSCAAERLDRYALIVLPAVWILAGVGAARAAAIGKIRFPRAADVLVPLCLLSLMAVRAPVLGSVIREDGKFFRGYDQAGQKVRQLLNRYPGALVAASDPDNIRYHADLDLGTEIVVHPLPRGSAALKALAASHSGPVIAEIDNWGSTGRPRFIPDGSGAREWAGLGFRPAGAFSRLRYRRPDGTVYVAPAVWVFVRE